MRLFVRFLVPLLALVLSCAANATVLLRIAHEAPLSPNSGATTLDFRVNGQPVAVGMQYGQTTPYLSLGGSANYTIDAARGGSGTPLVVATAALLDGSRYTVVALGNNQTQPFGLLVVQDTTLTPAPNSALIRVVHAAPYSAVSPLDISVVRASDGSVIAGLERIPYATPSAYVQIPALPLDLTIRNPDGTRSFVTRTGLTFPVGSVSTLIFSGDGLSQPFALTVLRDTAVTGDATVDQSASGAWTTGNAPGQGITLYPIPAQRRLVGTWYTYTPTGALQWYTLDSCGTPAGQSGCTLPNAFDNRRAVLTVYAPSGGRFLTTDPVALRVAGTLTITFSSCTSATATYDVDGRTGSFAMTNLIPAATCTIP
jgi:hypothetical protein